MMEKIEESRYEGYLWYSDQVKPKLIMGEVLELNLDEKANPFIIEGQLWDGKNSIGIKFVDGKYHVSRVPVDLSSKSISIEDYQAHRMEGVSGLRFARIWESVPDQHCNGYEVEEPTILAFIGFKKTAE